MKKRLLHRIMLTFCLLAFTGYAYSYSCRCEVYLDNTYFIVYEWEPSINDCEWWHYKDEPYEVYLRNAMEYHFEGGMLIGMYMFGDESSIRCEY